MKSRGKDLYDPLTMPPELIKAHKGLDRAVMKLYGFSKDATESAIVAALMERYQRLTDLGTRASRPHLVEKCGRDARVPRGFGDCLKSRRLVGAYITVRLLVIQQQIKPLSEIVKRYRAAYRCYARYLARVFRVHCADDKDGDA